MHQCFEREVIVNLSSMKKKSSKHKLTKNVTGGPVRDRVKVEGK